MREFFALGLVAILLTPQLALADTQYPKVTVKDGFPVLGACTTSQPYPAFADTWQAKTLLTPFDDGQLHFAQVAVSAKLGEMRVTTKGVSDGLVLDTFYRNNGTGGVDEFVLSDNNGALACTQVGANHNWRVPQPTALEQSKCTCQGENSVLGVDAQAWACQNGLQLSNGVNQYDWYWTAQNGDPVRFLFSRNNNAIGLPVLGEASMAHFTGYSETVPSSFADAAVACSNAITQVPANIPDPTIAGVSGQVPAGFSLPVWPDKIYSNGALTAVDGSFTEMAIYYDYSNLQEVSRIKYPRAWAPLQAPAGFINDTRLTKGETLEINEFPGQPAACGSILKNVGIWHPDWAKRDQCAFRANITAGSPLNPQSEDINALSCFFAGKSRIDAWYDVLGAPHMFYESNAGDLDLIDYYAFEVRQSFAPGRFNHPSCSGVPVQDLGTTCTTCHGKAD